MQYLEIYGATYESVVHFNLLLYNFCSYKLRISVEEQAASVDLVFNCFSRIS